MNLINKMQVDFTALPENEAFARLAVSGFMLPLNPTMEELADVKTAVSEAVTNAIVHGYAGKSGVVRLRAGYDAEGALEIDVIDRGSGIRDVERARQPFFTTCTDQERSGMGFTVMESFMDRVIVHSAPGSGTTVCLHKQLHAREQELPRQA